MARRNPTIDVALSALCKHAKPQQTMTLREIADVCDCSFKTISAIEHRALAKVKPKAQAKGLQLFLE